MRRRGVVLGTCDPIASSASASRRPIPQRRVACIRILFVRGREWFCDMRTQPPARVRRTRHRAHDLEFAGAAAAHRCRSPGRRAAAGVPALATTALGRSADHDVRRLRPLRGRWQLGTWLTLGGSRVFLQYRGGADAESTSFVASLAYRLVLPDATSSPALDHLPDDFFTTNPAASARRRPPAPPASTRRSR